MVADCFIENPGHKPYVDHTNENKKQIIELKI